MIKTLLERLEWIKTNPWPALAIVMCINSMIQGRELIEVHKAEARRLETELKVKNDIIQEYRENALRTERIFKLLQIDTTTLKP